MTDLNDKPKKLSLEERKARSAKRREDSHGRRRDRKIGELRKQIAEAKSPGQKAMYQRALRRHLHRSTMQTRSLKGMGVALKQQRDEAAGERAEAKAAEPKAPKAPKGPPKEAKQSFTLGIFGGGGK